MPLMMTDLELRATSITIYNKLYDIHRGGLGICGPQGWRAPGSYNRSPSCRQKASGTRVQLDIFKNVAFHDRGNGFDSDF